MEPQRSRVCKYRSNQVPRTLYPLMYTCMYTRPLTQPEHISIIKSMQTHTYAGTHIFAFIHRTHHVHRSSALHVAIFPQTIMNTHVRMHGRGNPNWVFLSLAKPQTAENQAEVEQSNPEKGEEKQGRENAVCVGGVRQ